MWPDPFGPGWVLGVLAAVSLLGTFVVLIWSCGGFQPRRDAADPVLATWRQYEQGAMTRQEFERARRAWIR